MGVPVSTYLLVYLQKYKVPKHRFFATTLQGRCQDCQGPGSPEQDPVPARMKICLYKSISNKRGTKYI